MNRHQVITGAANNFENSVAIGSVENNHFTAYGSGGNLIILSSNFDRVQIISSKNFSNSILKCIDCTLDTGKIAAAYGNKVHIYEPTPSAKRPSHNIKYKWVKVGLIEFNSDIVCISWNNDGTRLLVSCAHGSIQMWSYDSDYFSTTNKLFGANASATNSTTNNNDQVKFSINENDYCCESNSNEDMSAILTHQSKDETTNLSKNMFRKIWHANLSNPVKYLKFSPDGSLFASFGENDRFVKIWHEIKQISKIIPSNEENLKENQVEYAYVYLSHPRAVTSISWRQISKFMPRGMVSNCLISSCKDNICRIWTETSTPDDALLHSYHSDSSSKSSDKSTSHKRKLLNKLHKMRLYSHFPHLFNLKNASANDKINETNSHLNSSTFALNSTSRQLSAQPAMNTAAGLQSHLTSTFAFSSANLSSISEQTKSLHSSVSCHEFNVKNSHNLLSASMQSSFQFQLAGFIDPDAGIPLHLLPNVKQNKIKNATFTVHWMNNKDFHFTYLAEMFSKEIYEKITKLQSKEKNMSKSTSSDDLDEQDEDDDSAAASQPPPQFQTRTEYITQSKSNSYENIEITTASSNVMFENIALDDEAKSLLFGNSIEQKLDALVKEWYSSHDILYCIHPVDGSILIWLVDWLDEYAPNCYRQAQVSFHAKLPNTIPIGDALSLTNSVYLYTETEETKINRRRRSVDVDNLVESDKVSLFPSGLVHMVSKHNNGTLNLWKLQFQENSKYQSLINISHSYRVCGHRFRVGDITSHPILPFLLTNSVNNLIANEHQHKQQQQQQQQKASDVVKTDEEDNKFQKGLIIWGVEPIGPLSKSGGIYELARIDSYKQNAFENIAWFPCFLPSFTLGNSSSSPSTLFASTDFDNITIYQAVFDARTLLHDLLTQSASGSDSNEKLCKLIPSSVSFSSTKEIPFDSFNVVSIQSTARPGCIIELEQLADSNSNWAKADLFHIYQEGFFKSATSSSQPAAAQQQPSQSKLNYQFNETYFLILLEKKTNLIETVHMWKVNIQSSPISLADLNDDHQLIQHKNRLRITSTRVCQQDLPLPQGVYVVCADPAAADLSSSSMFSISKAPYLFTTACSDGLIRFWSCNQVSEPEARVGTSVPEQVGEESQSESYEFVEWRLLSTISSDEPTSGSHVRLDSYPLAISCSYNSRFAVAYKHLSEKCKYFVSIYECESTGGSEWKCEDCIYFDNVSLPEIDSGINFDYIFGNQKPIKPAASSHSFKHMINNNNSPVTSQIPSTAAKMSIKRQFSLKGGSESEFSSKFLVKLDWASTENGSHILTIGLGNQIYVYSCVSKEIIHSLAKSASSETLTSSLSRSKVTAENVNNQESLVKWILFRSFELDSADDMQALPTQIKWVRDGLLIIGLESEMQVYSQWSSLTKVDANNPTTASATCNPNPTPSTNIIKANDVTNTMPSTNNTNTLANRDSDTYKEEYVSSLLIPKNHSVLDLNKLHKLTKDTINSNKNKHNKKPKTVKFEVSDESDRTASLTTNSTDLTTTRRFDENELLEIAQDSGLFMQAKHARPVLPQYHPKQLLELMNSGKINRVKAILMHLTRCIIDFEVKQNHKISVEKKLKRKMSICTESEIPEEQPLNYVEVETIPPLPLFALFAADEDIEHVNSKSTGASKSNHDVMDSIDDYKTLNELDDLKTDLNDYDDIDSDNKERLMELRQNKEKAELKKNILNNTNSNSCSYFNSKVCKLLVEYLSYIQLNGLTSIDQMYLVALADTVTNVKCDVSFNKDEDVFSKKEFMGSSYDPEAASREFTNQTVDNCGFKFLLAFRSYNYLMRTLPLVNRQRLKEIGIGTFNFAWAFHSECEQELLDALPFNQSGNITWTDLRQYGIGWWLKNANLLRQLIEKVAKCSFQAKNDPLDAALFYLAMKKKGVLCGLFKTVKDTKMAEFFKNDFNESKWQTAALKNSFVLLGKQRFEHAVAFFLLAGRLKDAIEVCLRNLNDLQLALVIVRLYESDFESLSNTIKAILRVEVLGYRTVNEPSGSNSSSSARLFNVSSESTKENVSNDPFLRSMSYWYLKDYQQALNTLFDIDISYNKNQSLETRSTGLAYNGNLVSSKDSIISHVYNFYSFLKYHPLIVKQQQLSGLAKDSATTVSSSSTNIHPVERRLHFITAYYHLINGCPLLALDVLSKLPKHIQLCDVEPASSSKLADNKTAETTIVASQPPQTVDAFDWSTPLYNSNNFMKRFEDEELDLSLGSSSSSSEDEESAVRQQPEAKADQTLTKSTLDNETDNINNDNKIVDTFAQQLKFISCLKILIEEMSTLANGFEVVGGQLRYYMYYWLERETELLKKLGDFKSIEDKRYSSEEEDGPTGGGEQMAELEDGNYEKPILLHEHVLKDQKTFQEKINRVNKRKEWLSSNELLLRTFLSYCSLHGSSSAGLSSVKMELVLLMQELVEDRSMKQLLYPLPVQTTIPLLSASIASSKNIVAGPIQMIKSIAMDILGSISSISKIPSIFDYSVMITTIKESAISLSSCIYQCLCDSDVVFISDNQVGTGMQGFSRNILYKSSYLMSGMRKNYQTSKKSDKISTSPKNWPGISNLTKLLEREQDTEAPKLKILLFESLVAVYCSLLINAFIFYDCSTLWRLLMKQWDDNMWNRLFGGGSHIEYKYRTQSNSIPLDDENAKLRLKINSKLGHKLNMASQNSTYRNGEEKVEIRESFVAPEISMINFFLSDPAIVEDFKMEKEEYESDDEFVDTQKRDALETDNEVMLSKRYLEHMNPKSYSWCLMRFAIIKYTLTNIKNFLNVIGIEPQDIAIQSPLIHQIIKTFEKWSELIGAELNAFNGPPDDYIPETSSNSSSQPSQAINFNGPKLLKYQSIIDQFKTPFINEKSTYPARRLWLFLVTRKNLYDFFIRHLFKKAATAQITTLGPETGKKIELVNTATAGTATSHDKNPASFYKIVHKDQESIYSFCLNERDRNILGFCTSKDIIEVDLKNLLNKSGHTDDDNDIDFSIQAPRLNYDNEVYVMKEANPLTSVPTVSANLSNTTNINVVPSSTSESAQKTQIVRANVSVNVILKRNSKEVRRLAAHPTLPYYLSGTNESIVKLWHWGSNDPLSTFKQVEKASSPKITKLLFNRQGNKFGVSDVDGYLHLYQLLGCSFKPYLTLKTHQIINDFLFIESSSILLTIGTFNDAYIVSLWDTLLPTNKCLIKTFKEVDMPSGTCAAYSLLNHIAYCGNRKGEVNVYDVRTHKKLQKFVAHESCVKAITLDLDENLMATGSSEGNVKIWNSKTFEPYQVFHNEHSKSSIIRNFSSGVNQLTFTSQNQLLSCGTDGSIVIRNLVI